MANPQLRLVQEDSHAAQPITDPVRRVFEHWAFMLGRSTRRCKLGPTRRAAINAALAIGYTEDDLMIACEGMASVSFDGKPESMRDAMLELEWFLAREARIERAMHYGDQLRAALARPQTHALQPAANADPADLAATTAARERLRAMAARLRSGQHG